MKHLLFFTLLLPFQAVIAQHDTLCFQAKDSANGKDMYVDARLSGTNFGASKDYSAIAWTNQGTPTVVRSGVEFDLSSIAPNSQVAWAGLSLYNYATSTNNFGYHSSLSGANDAVINRITQPWAEYAATWNNQPATTVQNQAHVPQSTSSNQDYPNIDVTALVQDMVNDPANSHGFMIQLSDENYYRCLIFASSDHPDFYKHPKLCVLLASQVGLDEPALPLSATLEVWPNPSGEVALITWKTTNETSASLSIVDMQGRLVFGKHVDAIGQMTIHRPGFASGIYFLRLESSNGVSATKRIVFE